MALMFFPTVIFFQVFVVFESFDSDGSYFVIISVKCYLLRNGNGAAFFIKWFYILNHQRSGDFVDSIGFYVFYNVAFRVCCRQ